MNTETIARLVEDLGRSYSGSSHMKEGTRTFVRLPEVRFPEGCVPASTKAIVLLDEQADPQLLLETLPKLRNGNTPRSTNTQLVGETSWFGFSFNQVWDENRNSAVQFVEGRLRRFALNE